MIYVNGKEERFFHMVSRLGLRRAFWRHLLKWFAIPEGAVIPKGLRAIYAVLWPFAYLRHLANDHYWIAEDFVTKTLLLRVGKKEVRFTHDFIEDVVANYFGPHGEPPLVREMGNGVFYIEAPK